MINYVIFTSIIRLLNLFLLMQVEMSMGNDITEMYKTALRVKNGIRAKKGQFPYQIAFRKPKKHVEEQTMLYFSYCGGSLIGRNKILTAAHCFSDKKETTYVPTCFGLSGYTKISYKGIYAVAGVINNKGRNPQFASENGANQWREIYDTKLPPNYDFPQDDIALVFTSSPFEFNYYVQPLPYATRAFDYGWMHCLASGYGRKADHVKSKRLMWAFLELLPTSVCSKIHNLNMNRYICTQSNVTDVLQGDSGGPLVCNNTGDPADQGRGVVVGVVSGSRQGAGTFFTRVTSYVDFIATNSDQSISRTYRLRTSILFCSLNIDSFALLSLTKIINIIGTLFWTVISTKINHFEF